MTLTVTVEQTEIASTHLNRKVLVDFYLPRPVQQPSSLRLLLINDGQNLEEMQLRQQLQELMESGTISPVLAVGIHANEDRKMEYGVIGHPDYLGRGARAAEHAAFVTQELLPYIAKTYNVPQFEEIAYAGFSLGGLSALDITWNYPHLFKTAAVFSGSLWWRSVDQEDELYDDDKHRIMQQVIRHGNYKPGLHFFFQSGNMDETNDRNHNGIIDSIDDTLDLMAELVKKGYNREKDIYYLEMPDGRHDIPTWAKAIEPFLRWAFGGRGLGV